MKLGVAGRADDYFGDEVCVEDREFDISDKSQPGRSESKATGLHEHRIGDQAVLFFVAERMMFA